MGRRTMQANGGQVNGDGPPPSTLAAQLVQNQNLPSTNQLSAGTAVFKNVLHDLLHNETAVQETDVHINAQLISVVAEGGLLPLATDNPFADENELVTQAIDSILLIEKTTQRQPETLLESVVSDGPRVVLTLVATLFAVCGKPTCRNLPVTRLLSSMVRALNSSIDLWQRARALETLVVRSVDDILSALESSTASNTSIDVKIPPARSVSDFWSSSELSITIPPSTQITLHDPAQAFMAALLVHQDFMPSTYWKNETSRRLVLLADKFRSSLETAGLWETTLDQLLSGSCSDTLLASLLRDFPLAEPSLYLQKRTAMALLNRLRQMNRFANDLLLPHLRRIGSDLCFSFLSEDLKVAITTWLSRFEPEYDIPLQVAAMRDALNQDDVMSDSEFVSNFRLLSVRETLAGAAASSRSHKRRKILTQEIRTLHDTSIERASRLLKGVETTDGALHDAAPAAYTTLDEKHKCLAWESLAQLAKYELDLAIPTVSRLLELQEQDRSKSPRILSLLAVRACVELSDVPDVVSLGSGQFGKLCLASLHSSVRELRMAAGETLPSFLRSNLPSQVRQDNCRIALRYLRSLSDRGVASEHETLISAWGGIAVSCSDNEVNLVLLQLVEYLAHANALINALAFAEIETIARKKSRNVLDLMKPFWRSIAVSVVQDLLVRPQKVQQLCDLMNMDVTQFLMLTQQDTLPTLVLTKKRDILQRIANTRGKNSTVEDLIMQPRTNLAAVLALLLIQPMPDMALLCLLEVAPGLNLRDTELATLVKNDPGLIGCEMLRLCGDEEEGRKSRAYQSFHGFASLVERERTTLRSAPSKSHKDTAMFFDKHILGILTQFSIKISGGVGSQSNMEKLRSLKGIREMFILTKGAISGALPQIKACLQSGLGQPELCETAFSVWLSMLEVLQSDDVLNVVEETFALTVRHWEALRPEIQNRTHEAIHNMIRSHQDVLKENVLILPSLAEVRLLSKFATEFEKFQKEQSVENHFRAFTQRLKSTSYAVVVQALKELVPFLEKRQDFIHETAASDSPASVLPTLLRAVLDTTVKYSNNDAQTAELCGKAIGIIGCLDPNRIEAPRNKRQVMLLSNFERAPEAIDWTLTLLEDVLVKLFSSATNAQRQGFLAHAMQELLRFCNITNPMLRTRASQASSAEDQRWNEMPEHVRTTLTPFLSSRYSVTSNNPIHAPNRVYPGFSVENTYAQWLRSVTYDLMFKAKGDNAQKIFPLLARIIRGNVSTAAKAFHVHDLAIARFVFPYAVINVVLGGTVSEVRGLSEEFLAALKSVPTNATEQETTRLCNESIFEVLDYMSTWLMEKKKNLAVSRVESYTTGQSSNGFDEAKDMGQIDSVEEFLASIPAETVSNAALESRSFARALYHWEQFIRKKRPLVPSGRMGMDDEALYGRLLDIYSDIDEPDGLEGISAHMSLITEQQRAINHEKAGRWTAAQAWYELQVAESPEEPAIQHDLLRCLKETGRYAPLLRYADSFIDQAVESGDDENAISCHLPFAAEACWMTSDMAGLKRRLALHPPDGEPEFNIGVGSILLHAQENDPRAISAELNRLRRAVTEGLSIGGTESLQACHQEMFKLHVLYEIDALATAKVEDTSQLLQTFEKRLAAIGSYVQDKQFVLGVRRAVMSLHQDVYKDGQTGSLYLTTAKLARQTRDIENAYNAVLKAVDCGNRGAKLEEAKLLWHDGHQRQAIQSLEAAINSGAFDIEESDASNRPIDLTVSTTSTAASFQQNNTVRGKALLALAKWLDASGQSQTKDMSTRYQAAARCLQRTEQGHYYLSKHYAKLLNAQKALPKEKREEHFATGEMVKLVVDNSLRSLPFGSKYWHETIPRLLTLWLELGAETEKKAPREDQSIFDRRSKTLALCNRQIQKYFERVPQYVFYHALPQLISRMTHGHPEIWKQLSNILTRIAFAHPNQVLWSLLAVVKSKDAVRVARGNEVLGRLKDPRSRPKSDSSNLDLRTLINHGQKLTDSLLQACEEPLESKSSYASLSKNLKFNHKLAPSQLVVPIEATLNARSPPVGSNHEQIKKYKAFTQDKITIQAFDDSVFVLSSLIRPRKVTARGSDGKQYGLLCKPKDDLRKDKRLMEFNGIINRALKRDTESSKRRLYIKTYAVTPLSEESGILEWVEGIKPIRDILLNSYSRKGIRPNYNEIRKKLDEACQDEEHSHVFTTLLKDKFPPVLHEWFSEIYPEPDTWFAARLRYARSAAVMSMTGHMLGLGDRHGENILLEESTGGVFHVDFNCLFDKGLTFEKPEMVPFRLTHNMVDAMGAYGYEGPFRKSCELTLGLLRQEQDTLMTVLETFLYDPTTDFVGKKKRNSNVPETPAEILESVNTKLKGLLRGETVPLSVEGYVDALVMQATNPWRLASMYIGWCSFL